MKKILVAVNAWLTPRRRFWVGTGLLAATLVVPMVRPGMNMAFLLAPAVMLLLSAFGLWSGSKQTK